MTGTRAGAAKGVARLRAWVLSLSGWRAGGLAFLLGAFGVLAQPPFHIWPAMIVSLTGLIWLLDGGVGRPRPVAACAFRAWAFGFGYFAAGIWWIANAFVARGPEFYPLIPFAVTLAPAGLALFWAAAGAVCGAWWPASPRRIAVFALAVFAVEYLRGHILTGFPWQMAGMAWTPGGPVAQGAAWIGLYGLSLVTLYAFAAPAALWGPPGAGGARAPWMRGAPLAVGAVMICALFGAGLGRLADADPALTDVRVRLVQAAIPQDQKWLAENRGLVAERYLDLTAWPDLEYVDLVVWPEAALPILFPDSYGVTLAALTDLLAGRAALMTGVYRSSPGDDEYRNALAVLDFTGAGPRIDGLYDKVKLVPFGEFTPGGKLLTSLGFRLPNAVSGGFTPGEASAVLETDVAPPFAPLICYEIIFPRFIPRGDRRPQWMLNISNDSWFGNSAGPRQHFAQARFRAIEEGLPVIRSASGGISGAIDAYGRVRAELAPGEPAVLDTAIPVAGAVTFYSRYGDLASLLLCVALVLMATNMRAIAPRSVLTTRRLDP